MGDDPDPLSVGEANESQERGRRFPNGCRSSREEPKRKKRGKRRKEREEER